MTDGIIIQCAGNDRILLGTRQDIICFIAPQVGTDSMIGEQTKIGEKTSVKHSLVGAKCVIQERVKITNCIIMNGVTIQDR